MTNFERITQSPETLLPYIVGETKCPQDNEYCGNCALCWKDWLDQQSEEEDIPEVHTYADQCDRCTHRTHERPGCTLLESPPPENCPHFQDIIPYLIEKLPDDAPNDMERGKPYTWPCSCGGTMTGIRSLHNGHLHAACDTCGTLMME